jgi:tetratricopeptide (TPR) repeat protein
VTVEARSTGIGDMAFQGDLRNIGLATVLQNLHQNLQTGTLKLQKDRDEVFVFVKEGKIAMLARGAGSETPVGEYLLRAGKATREDIEQAQKRRRKGQRLGSALERAGTVTDKDVRSAVEQYVEEEVYGLFTWPQGSFDFKDGDAPEDIFDGELRTAELQLDPNSIILEAARRVDEWERINRVVGSLGDVYVVRREMAADVEKLTDPRARRVAELLDGRLDVAAVIRDSALGRFAVCQGLSKLISERLVRPIDAGELRALAERAESANELDEATRLMRKALEIERNDLGLRRRLAEILEGSGEKEEAASEYKLMANSLLDSGRTSDAADCLRRAIALRSADVTSRERLFSILSDSGGKTVAIETGMDLADTYAMLGLSERAKSALQRILDLGPKDRLSIERKLVDANLALGDVKSAIVTLRKAARRFLKGRDYEEAARYFEEILKLDAKDQEARKRVGEIQAGAVERMLERRRALVRSAVIAALSLPVLIFVVRDLASRPAEYEARQAAREVGFDAFKEMGAAEVRAAELRRPETAAKGFEAAARGFESAAEVVCEFRSRWGWTLSSRSAARDLAHWRQLAAEAWLAGAKAYEGFGRFDDAFRVYKRVSRAPGTPAEAAKKAEENLQRLAPLVRDRRGWKP